MIRDIKDIDRFVREINPNAGPEDREKIEKSLADFSTRVNDRVFRMAMQSPAIYKQFVSTPEEADSIVRGKVYKPRLFPVRGIERAYSDRALILPVYTCESYCRYCFLREGGLGQRPLSDDEVDKAIGYIRDNKDIIYVLITGGDPMINLSRLEKIMLELKDIPHVEVVRIGTRTILYDPSKFNERFFKTVSELRGAGKRVEIGAHMNHPDELDKEAMDCLYRLAENHVTVYTQTVLLKGINDDAQVLKSLYRKAYGAGADIYLLFHCDPISGIGHMRTKISRGFEIKSELADLTSSRLVPQYKVAKCELGVDSEVLEKRKDSILIKTPYRIENLKKNIPNFKVNEPLESISPDGRLIITYFGEW